MREYLKDIRAATRGIDTTFSTEQEVAVTTTIDTYTDALDLGDSKRGVDMKVDTTGVATLTIDVSTDGTSWDTVREIEYSEGVTNLEQFSFSAQYIRAKVDQNLTELEVVSRGVGG